MTNTIKILSDSTINKIAAGEVIERPASVIKELIDNAIDANANEINIVLEQAGKNLISVSDNGTGMTKDEILLAIKRHATSKLHDDNLFNIKTFGFRGEALPSIGEISRLTITSKKKSENSENSKAHKLAINGGDISEIEIVSANIGTSIHVRDLFFSTPARLKFLRNERTELNKIMLSIKKIALSHPHVSFNIIHNNKNILNLRKYNDSTKLDDNLKNRIHDIIGSEFIENMVHTHLETNNITINGYISIPTFNKASSEDQWFFVNKRPVKDKILSMATKFAYQDFLPKDRYPVVILFLDIPPDQLDVNVHPAKTEVRFYDLHLVRKLIIKAINNSISNNGIKVSNIPSMQAIQYMKKNLERNIMNTQATGDTKLSNQVHEDPKVDIKANNHFHEDPKLYNNYTGPVKKNNFYIKEQETVLKNNFDINASKNAILLSNNDKNEIKSNNINVLSAPHSDTVDKNIIEKSIHVPLGYAKAQINQTYIIAETDNSMILVDQHAAHERIGYEKIKQYMKENSIIKQRLLIPEIIEIHDQYKIELFGENKQKLNELGLNIEQFGNQSIIVHEIPHILGNIDVKQLILDIADCLTYLQAENILSDLINQIISTYACYYAIRAGRKMTILEMNELLRQIENTPFSSQCNHGRPTYIELKITDIEKLFHRT